MKYALVIDNTIDTISFQPVDGWVEVPDAVFAGFVWVGDGWAPPAEVYTPPTREEQQALRQAAYTAEADPIAMQMLRDEATKEEWLAKIEEIKARFPYPEA